MPVPVHPVFSALFPKMNCVFVGIFLRFRSFLGRVVDGCGLGSTHSVTSLLLYHSFVCIGRWLWCLAWGETAKMLDGSWPIRSLWLISWL